MASQVIFIDTIDLASLLAMSPARLAMIFGKQGIALIPGRDADGRALIRAHIDPRELLPAGSLPLLRDAYALLIASEPLEPGLALPIALPEKVVIELLDRLRDAMMEVSESAHDAFALAGPVAIAREAKPIRIERQPRWIGLPAAYCDEADRLSALFQERLQALDDNLAQYRDKVETSRLGEAVIRLGLQRPLGAHLCLLETANGLVARSRGQYCDDPDLGPLWRIVANRLVATNVAYGLIHDRSALAENWLDASSFQYLQRVLLANMPGCEHIGKWRVMPSTGFQFLPIMRRCDASLTGTDIWLQDFANDFDSDRWREVHPLIRATLAKREWLKAAPLVVGNRRLGNLIFSAMLHEDGLPPLPLQFVLDCYRDKRGIVGRMVANAPAEEVLELKRLCLERSVQLARDWLPGLSRQRDKLLNQKEGGARYSERFAVSAASSVLGPDPAWADSGEAARILTHALKRLDGIEAAICEAPLLLHGVDLKLVYSSDVARHLAAQDIDI